MAENQNTHSWSLWHLLGREQEPSLATLGECEAFIEGRWRRAQSTWPKSIDLTIETLLAFTAPRLPDTGSFVADVRGVEWNEVFIACACVEQCIGAIAAFEDRYFACLAPVFASLRVPTSVSREVLQLLREELFVGDEEHAPKICRDAGEGRFEQVVRSAGTRLVAQCMGPQEVMDVFDVLPGNEAIPDVLDPANRYRSVFKSSFEIAMRGLSPRQRTILRLQVIDRLRVDEICVLYRVHRVTVSRWLSDIRQTLLRETQRLVSEELSMDAGEFAEVFPLIESQLDLSLERLMESQLE